MVKKFLSVMLAVCLLAVSIASYPSQTVCAAQGQVDPDDLLEMLNDITIAGEAWESIGFSSEDIAEIMQLPRKDASFYEPLQEQFSNLYVETEQAESLEDALKLQPRITPYAQNGNPPESPEDQNERMSYVLSIAQTKYADKGDKYLVYLYMSHYIDNPYYSKSNPSFSRIYADVITDDDIAVYEDFITLTKFSMFSSNAVNLYDQLRSSGKDIITLKAEASRAKASALNTAIAVGDLTTYDPSDIVRRGKLIAASFKKNYDMQSVTELFDAIYEDLEPENVGEQYIQTCVLGFLGALATTTTVVGFGMSVSLCYYNFCNNLYDRARLTALHYTLSGRIAERVDQLIWG